MARSADTLTLTDPKALRALAHPARQALVRELFDGRVLTATEAADLVGLSPSAVSHHLRALERWGLARRAKPNADGRQRPWEGTARAVRIVTNSNVPPDVARSFAVPEVESLARRLIELESNQGNDPWGQDAIGLTTVELWLTREQLDRVAGVVDKALSDLSNSSKHIKGARRFALVWSALPVHSGSESR